MSSVCQGRDYNVVAIYGVKVVLWKNPSCLNSLLNSGAIQKMVAEKIGRLECTVKSMTESLQEKGMPVRKNGKRSGTWEVFL